MNSTDAQEMIAIVGLAGRFPKAPDLETFWSNLKSGSEGITFFSDEELLARGVPAARLKSPQYVKASPVLPDVDLFDAAFFGYAPSDARLLDPQQRLFLETTWHALEHAGIDPSTYPGAIGVFAGTSLSTYLLFNVLGNPSYSDHENGFEVMVNNDKDFLCTRVAYHFDLRGPSVDVQTGCSTSLVATHLACEALMTFQCDVALAGGVSVNVPQRTGYLHEEGGITSPDGHCRPFDARGQGTLFGSGVGVVVLKRLEDALRDGDTIHAVILSTAVNNDGAQKVGYTAPSLDGQAEVIFRAKALANVSAASIGYVEAHGTATSLGDPIELAALTQAFRTDTDARQFCAVGSVKSNIGHLDAAAGVAGLIKTVLALEHDEIPPTLHFQTANPALDLANSPFYVNSVAQPWPRTGEPRRAGVSSFGIGGTNAHAILQEAPPRPATTAPKRAHQVLLLSARTESALDAATRRLSDYLGEHPDANLSDVAFTLQRGRKRFAWRRSLVARDLSEARAALETRAPERVFSTYREHRDRPVVFMFPGGGAQHVNMGRELYGSESVFRAAVGRCAALLEPELGYDLRTQLFPERPGGDEQERIKSTSLGLPALFTISYAMAQQLLAWGVKPAAMIGHSMGEYVAACLAGVVSLEDALRVVVMRARLFEELPSGGMLSVLAPAEEVRALLGPELSFAAINSPTQCVVSGPVAAVEKLAAALAERDVDCQVIKINVAAHSPMVEQIVPRFVAWMKTLSLRPPELPFISDVSGTFITDEQATDPAYWGRHLRATVQFQTGVSLLAEQDQVFLEVGPGTTLSTLVRGQLERSRAADVLATMSHPRDVVPADEVLISTVGKLWAVGATIDWQAFHGDEARRRLPLPGYPFERQSFWIEPQAPSHQPLLTGKQPLMADWFQRLAWQQTSLRLFSETQLPAPASWVVFVNDDDLSRRVTDLLERSHQTVVRVRVGDSFRAGRGGYQLRPDAGRDYEALVAALRELPLRPDYVLHLWSLREARDFVAAQRHGCNSLIHLARAWHAEWTQPASWWVVGHNLHRIESQDTVDPNQAVSAGPCRVIPQEYPHLTCYSVDVGAPTAQTASYLLADVAAAPEERVLAYRGAQRWRQGFMPVSLGEKDPVVTPLREGGVYLITGGLGTVGLQWAGHLARKYRAKLVLVARSAFPARNTWPQHAGAETPLSATIREIQELEAAGAEVLTVAADVASEAQMRAAVAEAEQRFGRLHGIIHAAGIAGSKAISVLSDFEPTEREPQFLPKVHGTYALARIAPELDLDFVLLVSSTVGIFGGVGLTSYAASNAFLDAFVMSEQARGVRWISMNLDHLRISATTSVRTTVDQYTLEPEESAEVFERVLTRSVSPHVIVSTADARSRWHQWIVRAGKQDKACAAPGSAGDLHPRPKLETEYVAPSTHHEQVIAEIWQQTLGIDRIGIHDNFFHLGGDSLFAVRVTSKLRKQLQIDVPITSLYEGLTVQALAAIVADLAQKPADAEQHADAGERRARHLDRQERLQQQRGRRRS